MFINFRTGICSRAMTFIKFIFPELMFRVLTKTQKQTEMEEKNVKFCTWLEMYGLMENFSLMRILGQ